MPSFYADAQLERIDAGNRRDQRVNRATTVIRRSRENNEEAKKRDQALQQRKESRDMRIEELKRARSNSIETRTKILQEVRVQDTQLREERLQESPRARPTERKTVIEIKKDQPIQRLKANNIEAEIKDELTIENSRIILKKGGGNFEVRKLPRSAKYHLEKNHPGYARLIELKVQDNKPVYTARGGQTLQLGKKRLKIGVESTLDAGSGDVIDLQEKVTIEENGQEVAEKNDEIFLVGKNDVVKIQNLRPRLKNAIRRKLASDSVITLVDIEKIKEVHNADRLKQKLSSRKHRFVLQTDGACSGHIKKGLDIIRMINTKDFEFLIVRIDLERFASLLDEACVVKIGDAAKIRDFVSHAKKLLEVEREELFTKDEMEKSYYDLESPIKLNEYLNADQWTPQAGKRSIYQDFITPNTASIQSAAAGLSKEALYKKALDFVWISDSVLHKTPEKWLLPEELLTKTAQYQTNPTGRTASDCSEQANTLVSLLRASGVPPEDVRVALGTVDFGEGPGGHAWVEIKENGQWMVLEATAGPFYDEISGNLIERSGLDYDYYRYHEYPLKEVWAYYNDVYFTDTNEEIAAGWSQAADTILEKELETSIIEDIGEDAKGAPPIVQKNETPPPLIEQAKPVSIMPSESTKKLEARDRDAQKVFPDDSGLPAKTEKIKHKENFITRILQRIFRWLTPFFLR